jgi:hypothetical protein
MKNRIILFFSVCLTLTIQAQEKAPIAEDDYIFIMAGDTVLVNVMANDWGMEGHTIQIMNCSAGGGGTVVKIDSCLNYISFYSFGGVDTVRYMLVDLDNGLFSEIGSMVVTVENHGRSMLDVNNIEAFVQSFGFQFCEIADEYMPRFTVPAGSKLNTLFVFNMWMGGLDAGEQLHFAAERYRGLGNDFWNGPVSETYLNQQQIDYNKVWTLDREMIDYHRQHWWEAGYVPQEEIATWPAHGDPALGQADRLAPFNDKDHDGEYDPVHGDYPAIRGDKGVFFIYNDDFGPHTESQGERIGAEVQGQAYAYACPDDSAFFNTIFLHYDILSRADQDYHDFYLGMYVDIDIGFAWDDFLGCDTVLNAFYGYNGDAYDDDDTVNAFVPTYGYRDYPPAQGIVFLNHPMHSFIGYSNFGGVSGDPSGAEEMFNSLKGLWKDGTPITVGGNGIGGTEPTRYLFPGDPSNPDDWTEISSGNAPSDRRAIAGAGPFDLPSGDTLQLDLALVFARDYQGDHISSIDLLKERIAQVRWYYDNDSTPCGKTWSAVNKTRDPLTQWRFYPNPASDFIRVDMEKPDKMPLKYRISDLTGKTVAADEMRSEKETINTSRLSKGVYILEITGGDDVIRDKFIKK